MSQYVAPLKDMLFVLRELTDLDAVAALPGHEEISIELAAAILEEAGRFAGKVLSPLNQVGDRHGAHWLEGDVVTAPGWREAYAQFVAGGWNALSCPERHGGQGLPRTISALVEEMWNSANLAFALCPMLTRSAIEALELCGSDTQKAMYLPSMVSGQWTGTMNLTEPQAGSDLAAIRTRALPRPDGSYLLHGQKIFITYGDHDLTDNIVHLVLARTPDAPEGVKGLSLFVVPKFLPQTDGRLDVRNDVRCASLEHKLGIHGSPTAVLVFGDHDGATGWMVGEKNRGLEYMFIMMNAARYSVGLEGIGVAERATQRALAYARNRVQGTEIGIRRGDRVAIIQHPDVRRMLLQMKARTEAMRALAVVVAAAMDAAERHPDPDQRRQSQAFVNLMIPVVKGWCTENGVEVASLGVQVHGGMGFIEETGAAQHLRDARIMPIYEGTTGIQANDLVFRKFALDGGESMRMLIDSMRETEYQLAQGRDETLSALARRLREGISALSRATDFVVAEHVGDAPRVAAGAVPFLYLAGIVTGGWQMARAGLAAHRCLRDGAPDAPFYRAKLATARFYADHVLTGAPGLAETVVDGAQGILAVEDEAL
jgi:alkylation response protein AidB-like acyl-CoA dehydrogenase